MLGNYNTLFFKIFIANKILQKKVKSNTKNNNLNVKWIKINKNWNDPEINSSENYHYTEDIYKPTVLRWTYISFLLIIRNDSNYRDNYKDNYRILN